MAKANGWTPSGIVDAICNVNGGEAKQLDQLIIDLTRQLAVAKAVRAALDDEMLPYDDPPATIDTEETEGAADRAVTENAAKIGQAILRRGALTKVQIASDLGWTVHQVSMVITRNKSYFVEQGKKYLCSAELAAQLES